MACGKCGKGNRHTTTPQSDLKKFAYLTPRQLRLLNGEQPSEDQPAPISTDSNIPSEESE